jgi:hypothetical protein
MDISGFNPNRGPAGTAVTIQLEDAPPDATVNNTVVLISGDPQFIVNTVNVGADGSGTISGSIDDNAQSGDFGVLVDSPAQGQVGAQSAAVFTVTVPPGQPRFTTLNPRTANAGQSNIMLMGSNLDQVQSLRVGNLQVTVFQRTGTTQFRFTIPMAVQPGPQRVYGQSLEFGRVNCPVMLTVNDPGAGQ